MYKRVKHRSSPAFYHLLHAALLVDLTITGDVRRLLCMSHYALEQQPVAHQPLPWYRQLILQPQLLTVRMTVRPLHHHQQDIPGSAERPGCLATVSPAERCQIFCEVV